MVTSNLYPLFLLLVSLLTFGCEKGQDRNQFATGTPSFSVSHATSIIRGVKGLKRRFLVISKDVCHTCFEQAKRVIGSRVREHDVDIIILGNDEVETSRLNSIYNRFGLNFVFVQPNLIGEDVLHLVGVFSAVRHETSGIVSVYDGVADYQDIERRTEAVLSYLLDSLSTGQYPAPSKYQH